MNLHLTVDHEKSTWKSLFLNLVFFGFLFNQAPTIPVRGGGRGMRGMGRGRGNSRMNDVFRSRKQNTSRPPSMHVDDFMAMEHAKTHDSPPPVRRTGSKVSSWSFFFCYQKQSSNKVCQVQHIDVS